MANRDKEETEREVPRVAIDYFFMSQEDERAQDNPMVVMVDERTGQKYARAVGHKGLGQNHDRDWVIKDMSMELKSWGHLGGTESQLILKSDSEGAMTILRDALAKYHGG